MKKQALILVLAIGLVGCAATSVKDMNLPDGSRAKNVKCNIDSQKCFQAATESCTESNGKYRVTASHSNAGGTAADILPGPVTWFNMTYICGESDGLLPKFEFRGERYIPQPTEQIQRRTTRTTCNTFNGVTNCTTR
jgi:hypothetical protein